MREFKQLKKAARNQTVAADAPVLVVLGDSATQFLATAIRGEAGLAGLELRVVDTDYD